MSTFEFKIRNIKHYGDVPKPILLDLNRNKLNYIVAPNGAGKTSFVTAFECLETGRIKVPKELKHKKQERPASSLTINVDGTEWAATGRTNKITPEWNPFVINSRISSEVVAVGGERGALLNETQTKVRRIKVIDNIPALVHITYDFNAIKSGFGAKKNALRDFTALFEDKEFLFCISKSLPALYQFNYRFIGYRDWLKEQGKNGDAAKLQLYHDLSNYLFHYNPTDYNCSAQIAGNQHPHNAAKTTWGEKSVFYTYLIKEVNKYLSGQDYEPYAVAFAIRIRIEKIAYDSIANPVIKSDFLSKNDSYAKIKVCTDNNIKVPTFYMMVLAIGNESAHLKMINGNYEEKEMVFKLRNLSVKRIIEQVFDKQEENPVALQSIYL